MKIYTVSWLSPEHGVLEAFSNKSEAIKRHNHLLRRWPLCPGKMCEGDHKGECVEHVNEIGELDFPISKAGIIAAYEAGANDVMK